jgi:hypothetical protein
VLARYAHGEVLSGSGDAADIAAIKDDFPEDVWLNAVFRFLVQRRYLTVVFQGDDAFLSMKVPMNGARSSITASQEHLRQAFQDGIGKWQAIFQYIFRALEMTEQALTQANNGTDLPRR